MFEDSKEALILQLCEDSSLERSEVVDILSSVNWDYNDAKKALQEIYGISIVEHVEAPAPKAVFDDSKEDNDAKFVVAESNEKFNEKRKIADEKKRWLLVYISEKPCKIDPFVPDGYLRDLMNCNFVGFITNTEEPDGKWFTHAYKITELPSFCIIDPLSGQMVEKTNKNYERKKLHDYLEGFLRRNRKYGVPIEWMIDSDDDNYEEEEKPIVIQPKPKTIEMYSKPETKKNTETEPASIEKSEEGVKDPGEIVQIKIQVVDGKQTMIEIGVNELIKTLYHKIGLILNRDPSSFLISTTFPVCAFENTPFRTLYVYAS